MKVLVSGKAQGHILHTDTPINFLGMIDKQSGKITDTEHPLYNISLAGHILSFPHGAGSSVGAYTIYSIKSHGVAPAAMLCEKADTTVASGCAISGIPLVVISGDQRRSIPNGAMATLDTSTHTLSV